MCTVAKHEQPWAPSGAAMTNAMLQPKHAFRVLYAPYPRATGRLLDGGRACSGRRRLSCACALTARRARSSSQGGARRWEAVPAGPGGASPATSGPVQGVAEAQAGVEPRPSGLARRGTALTSAAATGPDRSGAASPSSDTSASAPSSGALKDPTLVFGPMPPPSLRKAQRSLSSCAYALPRAVPPGPEPSPASPGALPWPPTAAACAAGEVLFGRPHVLQTGDSRPPPSGTAPRVHSGSPDRRGGHRGGPRGQGREGYRRRCLGSTCLHAVRCGRVARTRAAR